MPGAVAGETIVLPFNNIEAVRAAFRENKDQVAGVILEPIPANAGLFFPRDDFLHQLQEECAGNGALLIFDEVMSGFRVARGGAQQLYGIRPDLAALGKVIGGGLPVGAFGGRAEIMDQLSPDGPVYQAGTLSGNPLALAAGLAQLRELDRIDGWRLLEDLGAKLESRLADAISGKKLTLHRIGSMFCLFFASGPVFDLESAQRSDTKKFAQFFHSIYPTPQSEVAAYLSSIEWFALTVFLFGVGVFAPPLRIVPYLMFGGTLCVALSYMVRARIEPRFDTILSRLLVMFLAFAQPLVRGWSRYFTWLHFKRTPGSVIAQHEKLPVGKKFGGNWGRLAYWNEEGKDRHNLLREIFTLLDQENWRYSIDTGWQEWDIHIYGNFWWSIILRTVTEYHGGGKCLTRVQLRYRYVTTTVIVNLIVLALLIYHFLNTGHVPFIFAIPYALFALFLFLRARRLKTRVRTIRCC